MAKAKAKKKAAPKKTKPAAKAKKPAAKKPATKAKAKPAAKAKAKPAAKKPAAKKPAAKKPAAKAKPAPKSKPAASAPGTIPPLPQLPPGEDEPFDIVADYFVAATAAAGADDALLGEAIANAIRGFYDAMEAGGGERGEYAGHFFLADGAALGTRKREVPIRRITDQALVDRINALWEELERAVE